MEGRPSLIPCSFSFSEFCGLATSFGGVATTRIAPWWKIQTNNLLWSNCLYFIGWIIHPDSSSYCPSSLQTNPKRTRGLQLKSAMNVWGFWAIGGKPVRWNGFLGWRKKTRQQIQLTLRILTLQVSGYSENLYIHPCEKQLHLPLHWRVQYLILKVDYFLNQNPNRTNATVDFRNPTPPGIVKTPAKNGINYRRMSEPATVAVEKHFVGSKFLTVMPEFNIMGSKKIEGRKF